MPRSKIKVQFPFAVSLALIILVSVSFYLADHLGHYTADDVLGYREMVDVNRNKSEDVYASKQERKQVQKDLFFTRNNSKLHLYLISRAAELALDGQGGNFNVIEKMTDLACCLQEDLLYLMPDGSTVVKESDLTGKSAVPVQKVLYFEADDASYSYQDELLVASNAKGSHYLAAGHALDGIPSILSPLETCSARHLELAMGGREGAKDKKIIALSGGATIKNALGSVNADRILSETEVRGGSFDSMELDEHVQVALKEGGELHCDRAKLDFNTLQGTFSGQGESGYVQYQDKGGDKNGKGSFILQGRHMVATLVEKTKGSLSGLAINQIKVEGDVTVNYNRELTVKADRAVFQRREAGPPGHSLQGLITLYSDAAKDELCTVTNLSGSLVHAEKIEIDTIDRTLVFTNPRGTLTRAATEKIAPMEFVSDTLVWNDASGKLTLKGNVKVNQPGVGRLQNNDEVHLWLSSVHGGRSIKMIDAKGESRLTYTDEAKGLSHALKCYGEIKVDHEKMETRLYSPLDGQGNVISGKQVFFEDAKGDIYADTALVQYSKQDGTIVPHKIVLNGNIRIANRLPSLEDAANSVLQYILADQVEFYPQTSEMTFTASNGRRVLFFDKVNVLELSAPGLKIIRDKATKKETVQGLGDVRFSFIEPEFEQLRSRFSLDRSEVSENKKSSQEDK